MDHIVYLDANAKELENLIVRNKSMIIRGADEKILPYDKVTEGDVLYFVNSNRKDCIQGRGLVAFVVNSGPLTCEESFETIIRNQNLLQLTDDQFYKVAGMKYLVLIGLASAELLEQVVNYNSINTIINNWMEVGSIDNQLVDEKTMN